MAAPGSATRSMPSCACRASLPFRAARLVVILSDGLERGDPAVLTGAVAKLSTLAWRIAWLTPLLADAGYAPQTAALKAVLPYLDHLGSRLRPTPALRRDPGAWRGGSTGVRHGAPGSPFAPRGEKD